MKLRTVVLSLLLALLVAACEKASDLGPLQDEANAIANSYKARFEGLGTRLKAVDERSRKLPVPLVAGAPDLPQLKQLASDTNSKLTDMRNLANNAQTMVSTAANAPNPRDELVRVIGELNTKFDAGHTLVNSNLDTVESWIAYLELRPSTPPPAPATEPAEVPAGSEPAGEPAGEPPASEPEAPPAAQPGRQPPPPPAGGQPGRQPAPPPAAQPGRQPAPPPAAQPGRQPAPPAPGRQPAGSGSAVR